MKYLVTILIWLTIVGMILAITSGFARAAGYIVDSFSALCGDVPAFVSIRKNPPSFDLDTVIKLKERRVEFKDGNFYLNGKRCELSR